MDAETALKHTYPWLLPAMARFGLYAIAGGWAVDLHIGRVTREHSDIEVAILRPDQHLIHRAFNNWQFDYIKDHTPFPWTVDQELKLPVHEVHCAGPYGQTLEILLNEADADNWIYRRNNRITLPFVETFLQKAGYHYLNPIVVLLYKSKKPRDKDHADFKTLLPTLDEKSCIWLLNALKISNGEPSWIDALQNHPSPL